MASLGAGPGVSPEVLAVFGYLKYGGEFGVFNDHVLGVSEASLLVAAMPFLGFVGWFGGGEVGAGEKEGVVSGCTNPF